MKLTARRPFYNPFWVLGKIALWTGSYCSYKRSDIVLALFPKTGSTWIRFFFYTLLRLADDPGATPKIDQMNAIMPEFGHSSMFTKWPFASVPRLIKTHRPYNILMKNHRVVLVVRDPRDIMISYFHYASNSKKINFSGTIKNIIYHPKMGLDAFFKHYTSWRNRAGLVLQYEKLKNDPFREFTKLIDFVSIKASDEIINNAIAMSDFQQMREAQKKSRQFKDKLREGFVFARSGASAQWQGLFDDADIAYWELLREKYDFSLYE